MQKILNSAIPYVKELDISTGYFDIMGYGMLRESLENSTKDDSFKMRLLLGKEAVIPAENSFEKYARQYRESTDTNKDILSIKTSLDGDDLTLESRSHTTSLIELLQRQNVQVRLGTSRFNHSKCYVLGDDSTFIGSSNFTGGGLTGNYELNAGLYQPGVAKMTREWFDRMWDISKDAKEDLITVLKQSKFGVPPEPFQVYMKMLFERYRPLLEKRDPDPIGGMRLARFQQDAVRTAMFITSEFGGAMIADATGLGKTNMGIEIVRQKILKEGKKVMLIAPAQVLHSMWGAKLEDVDINIRKKITMESLGREAIQGELGRYRNIDFILIDESQNFRSKGANRRKNLMKLMSIGKPKQVVLLSATPINNSLMDLYYQLSIITGGDDSYFYKRVGIPNLYKHMRDAANKEGLQQGLEKIQQLLDSVMVRRTRSYIREVYSDDKINDMEIKFPEHEYAPIHYSLNELYGDIFDKLLNDINSLKMAPYGIEQYNTDLDPEMRQKHKALSHLQVLLLLKRFESSVEAVKISIRNKVDLYTYVDGVIHDDKILRVRDFNKIMMKWNQMDEPEDGDESDEERDEFFLEAIKKLEKEKIGNNYDKERLKRDMADDLEILKNLQSAVEAITMDKKLDAVAYTIQRQCLLDDAVKKILIFTEYTATAKYITRCLKDMLGKNKVIKCITGGTRRDTRSKIIRRFAPESNPSEEVAESQDDEIDILVSTEVLSEGQNLQDCNYVINYDLPWNPMRIVQRTGRIDRLTSKHDTIHVRACYPDRELDKILKLVGKLIDKIGDVNATIGLDEEVLGETPTPKQFNGSITQRIEMLAGGDGAKAVIDEMQRESDMMPQSSPVNELGRYIKKIGIDFMKEIPMGRRSGKKGEGQKAILAYLQEGPEHQVYFVMYDYKTNEASIPRDDHEAIKEISCVASTERYLPMDGANNQESFEMLLQIDQKARNVIRERNDLVAKHEMHFEQDKLPRYEKTLRSVKQAVMTGVMEGRIADDEGNDLLSILKSSYIRPWEDEIADLLTEHERTRDMDILSNRIKKIGERIHIEEKPKPIPEEKIESKLRLIGAMFITGDKFDKSLVQGKVDEYTTGESVPPGTEQ